MDSRKGSSSSTREISQRYRDLRIDGEGASHPPDAEAEGAFASRAQPNGGYPQDDTRRAGTLVNWSTAASSTALHARKTTALPPCWSPARTFSLGAEAHEIEAPFHVLSKHSLSPANHKRIWHSPRTIGSGVPYRPVTANRREPRPQLVCSGLVRRLR